MLAAVPLLFAATAAEIGNGPFLTWLSTWATTAAFFVGAAVCFGRARLVQADRTWGWFGVACTLWAASNLYYALVVAPDPLPLPSPADIGYVGFPLAICAGLVHSARARLPGTPADVWLDGLVTALGTAAVASAFLFALVDVSTDNWAETATSLVYPLEDAAVLGVLVGVGSLFGWRLNLRQRLLAAAILSITAADVIVSTRVLSGSSAGGAWCNLGWTAGIALIAAAAWVTSPATEAAAPAPRVRLEIPVAFAATALTVLAVGNSFSLSPVAAIFAVGALTVSGLRLLRAFREIGALAGSRRLALTDELTDLPNRRRLLSDLERVCAARTPQMLAFFDLDGFKHYNDTHGHPEGDELLIRVSARLAATVAPVGVAYRLGGDEFCVLATATAAGRRAIEMGGTALTESGSGWSVGASFGVVELPREADTVPSAMRLADHRMYAQKDRRPAAARRQAQDVLLSALGEQQPDLRAHAQDVTALVEAVGRRLGMAPDDVDDVVMAAELHDVGKLAIPREILDKPGPLSADEWEVMRQHTIIGARMIGAAPSLEAIAPLVRSSHERWDGQGYPDGLAGEAIPLGARIIAVCDAFDAMIADRAYRSGMTIDDAVAELARCAGTQFDPRVVGAFLWARFPADAVTPVS